MQYSASILKRVLCAAKRSVWLFGLLLALAAHGSAWASPARNAPQPDCVARIAAHYGLELRLVQAILRVEGGWVGLRSRNTNGTYDLGPMQINTLWLPQLQRKGISEHDLVWDYCANVAVGAWILARELHAHPVQPFTPEFWHAVGRYHSRTPHLNVRYAVRVWKQMRRAELRAVPRS